MLGNVAGQLNLSKPRLLDFCLMVERHPDNVAAALYGGFVGTYLNDLDPVEAARKEVPLSEVLPQPAGGVDTGLTPPIPPLDIGHFRRFKWASEIKAVAIIPDFEVPTSEARQVLPKMYSRQDMVCRPVPLSNLSFPLPFSSFTSLSCHFTPTQDSPPSTPEFYYY